MIAVGVVLKELGSCQRHIEHGVDSSGEPSMPEDREQKYEYSCCDHESEQHRAGVMSQQLEIGRKALSLSYFSH